MKRVGFFYLDNWNKKKVWFYERWKIAAMIITALMSMWCMHPERASAADPVIRVLLTTTDFSSRYHDEVTVSYNGKEITYKAEDLKQKGNKIRIPAQKDGIQILSIQRQSGHPVYEGSIEIIPGEEGLEVVNELSLEKYLTRVVPSEMPSAYGKEALKAQAVCARTYAWKQIQEHSLKDLEADVDDSVSFQVYGNIAPQEASTEAVRETESQILCQNGEAVEAYYFSTSAGVTSTDEIWGSSTAAPYLKSVPCQFDEEEPWSSWKVEIPWKMLEERAKERLGKEAALQGINVVKRSESGAATELEIVLDSKESFEIKNEYEIREFLAPAGCTIIEKDGTETQGGKLLPSAYFELERMSDGNLFVSGKGYGHGVGMSQTGAKRMAEQGYDYKEILDYFFRNVTIENLG